MEEVGNDVKDYKIGEIQLRKIIDYYGLDVVIKQMFAIQENAKEACLDCPRCGCMPSTQSVTM